MHGRLAGLRSVSPPGHLQAVGQRSRAARQQRGGGATLGAPAEQPDRSRGAFCDEQSTTTRDWTAPGHPPGRLATGGRSAADGKRRSAARRAARDSSSVHRRVARCGAGPPRECGAAVGIGGGCEQVRGSCAPLLQPTRRSVGRLRATPLGDWQQVVDLQQMGRGAAPPGERLAIAAASTVALPDVAPDRRGNVAPRWGLVAAVNRFAGRVRRCSSRRAARSAVRGPAECRLRRPKWRPASPARRCRHGSHPPRRRTRTSAPK